MNQSPNHIILHRGTNSLPKEENPESIAENIITAKKVKTKTNLVSISEIIPCNDKFNLKAMETNNHLKDSFFKERIPLIRALILNIIATP